MKSELFSQRWNSVMEANYGTPEIALMKGKGVHLWDVDGKKYLDFLGGIATNALGHVHPKIVAAVNKQISTLSHTSNLYSHEAGLLLAEKLQSLVSDSSRIFFCNSGAEANEAALKISRLSGRTKILSTQGAFHGRTVGALSLTGQPSKRTPFIPLMKGIRFVPYGDVNAVRRAINRKVAMVIVEPIQGENGVVVPPPGYLKEVRQLCTDNGVLMCIDAVQTGMGRTGTWFGFESEGILPDILTLAKGLGGGLPLGAMVTIGANVPHFSPGDHGSTFGGNPISVSAGLATVSAIEKGKLLKNASSMEKLIRKSVSTLPGVAYVRGKGLLLGVVLEDAIAKKVVHEAARLGLLINAPQQNVVRLAPPLIITAAHVQEFTKKFALALSHARGSE
ncbi:MAG: hypothetical protein RL414_1036 [Actinomycetota bacterium]